MQVDAEDIDLRVHTLVSTIHLHAILLNLFLEQIMQETLQDHHASISSTGERPIYNLRFADDIDLMGGSNGELQDLTNGLVDRATALLWNASQHRTEQDIQSECPCLAAFHTTEERHTVVEQEFVNCK